MLPRPTTKKGIVVKQFLLAAAVAVFGQSAAAENETHYVFDGSFDDATFSVESAIVGRGLVIDYISHTGEMLNRTQGDIEGAVALYDGADIFVFCSAVLSRKMMEADPLNVAQCPYGIYVADRAGEVTIGYRHYPDGVMQEVQALLDDIAREAVGE
ncbi:MAG: DUF302 domain-containing protein [Yoonia sp.]|nr:DUF302 domain-containing protein [Yoonia sp.]